MLAITFSAWTPETWTVVATVTVYVVGLVFAWRQVREARRLREEQVRPWVAVYFDVNWLTDISIENIGSTVAQDVRVTFDPPLTSTYERPWPWEESSILRDGIPTLPPHRKISIPFDATHERFEREADFPLTYAAEVSYLGRGRKRLTERHVLDLALYKGTRLPPKDFSDFVSSFDKFLEHVKKWTYTGGGLRVRTTDQDRLQRWESRRSAVTWALRKLHQEGWAGLGHFQRTRLTGRWRRWVG